MNKIVLSLSALGLAMSAASAQAADTIGGVAKADFATDELSIPCVQLVNFDGKNNNAFFDVILVRRGNSFNYELSVAEPEDAAFCQRLADFANFEDDDLDEDGSGDDTDAPKILAQCEARAERSIVSVQGKNLEEGDYTVALSSGDNTIETDPLATLDDEVEFEFDSDADEVLDGDIEIDAAFIVDNEVEAELINAAGETVLTTTATCMGV